MATILMVQPPKPPPINREPNTPGNSRSPFHKLIKFRSADLEIVTQTVVRGKEQLAGIGIAFHLEHFVKFDRTPVLGNRMIGAFALIFGQSVRKIFKFFERYFAEIFGAHPLSLKTEAQSHRSCAVIVALSRSECLVLSTSTQRISFESILT